jgi:hypothetical protein
MQSRFKAFQNVSGCFVFLLQQPPQLRSTARDAETSLDFFENFFWLVTASVQLLGGDAPIVGLSGARESFLEAHLPGCSFLDLPSFLPCPGLARDFGPSDRKIVVVAIREAL